MVDHAQRDVIRIIREAAAGRASLQHRWVAGSGQTIATVLAELLTGAAAVTTSR